MTLILCITFIISFKQAEKVEAITFPNWYSDIDEVGYWANNPKVFYTQLNSFGVMSYLERAINKWKAAGISSSITTTPSNASIKFYCGSKAELNGIGFLYGSYTRGLTLFDSATIVSNIGSPYKVKKFSAVSASIAEPVLDEYKNGEKPYPENVTLHEYSHALGWIGHSSVGNDVMWQYEKNNITLTNRDKNQLIQVYNEMR